MQTAKKADKTGGYIDMRRMELMSWTDFSTAKAKTDLVIVPVGAVEVYGPHLPLGSDGLVALKMSELLAKRCGALVAPLVPVGYSEKLSGFPGTLSVSTDILRQYLKGICVYLASFGFKKMLFLNGHAGNVGAITELGDELLALGVRSAQVDWWRFVQDVCGDIPETEQPYGHAGEIGTSVLMYLWSDLVDMKQAVTGRGAAGTYPGVTKAYRFKDVCEAGVVGDPFKASAAKGEMIIGRALQRLEAVVREI
jgi:creatinine amidohydrolase